MGHNQLGIAIAAALRYLDMAGKQNKGTWSDLAGREDARARRVGSALAKPGNAANIRHRQHRKHLVMSRVNRGLSRRRHGV